LRSAGRVGDPVDAAGHLDLNGHRIVRNASRNSCGVAALQFGVEFASDPRLPVMAIEVSVPGTADPRASALASRGQRHTDNRGQLIPGVQPRIEQLRPSINVRLLSSDAFGTLDDVAQQFGDLPINRVSRGEDKSAPATQLGSKGCAAIGNDR
jgi:hypothetical protein